MHSSEFPSDALLPLLWIPTRGSDIPPHAVPVQGGFAGQAYIARGLLWDEMHIGTTSHASTHGARLYDEDGQGHDVFEYEVLTCASSVRFQLEPSPPPTPVTEAETEMEMEMEMEASPLTPRRAPSPCLDIPHGQATPTARQYQSDPPPYTSPKERHGWIKEPQQPGPIALNPRENVQFERIARSKCFTLIDDTASMQYAWPQTRGALAGIVDLLSSNDKWDGLDVRFLHHSQTRSRVKTRDEFNSIFNSVAMWRGQKVMAAKVRQVFEESLGWIHGTSVPRPVIVLILTDGMAADAQELFDAMSRICQELHEKRIPPHMFRMHMLQMGEDRKGVQPLQNLRDRITQRDRERRILDVVSYHRGRGLLNAQNIFKLLLASTNVPVEEDPDIGERQARQVVAAQYGELEAIRAMRQLCL